ncbi:MAG: hypothetical protein ABH881_00065 [bacterium]
MQEEKWKNIVGNIKDNFEVEEHNTEHIEEEGGVDIEYIIFRGPLGRIRMEYISKPIVLDRKTTYSNRIGSGTKIDYVYSSDERSQKLETYKWDENEEKWVEMEAKNFI